MCDYNCPGWGVFDTEKGTTELQRCDDCRLFVSDLAAASEALSRVAKNDLPGAFTREDVLVAVLGDLYMALGKTRPEISKLQEECDV